MNPVVVLSDNAKILVDHHISFYMGEAAPQLVDVLAGPDDRYFINYLVECVIETDEGNELDAALLNTHKEQVEKRLSAYADKPSVLAKYAWLAEYHNYFCGMVETLPGYSASLRIARKVPPVSFRRLKQVDPPSLPPLSDAHEHAAGRACGGRIL